MKDQTGSRGMAHTLSLTSALDGGGWLTPRPGRFTPGKETQYPSCRRLGGSQGLSAWVRKISPRPALDPRTVQPVASRYTDWPITARKESREESSNNEEIWQSCLHRIFVSSILLHQCLKTSNNKNQSKQERVEVTDGKENVKMVCTRSEDGVGKKTKISAGGKARRRKRKR